MKPYTQSTASPDAIDRILSSDQELVPSSGFLATVMERVREEAIAPKPIPFPWKLAVPGMVLAVGTIGWRVYEFIRTALAADWQFRLEAARLPEMQLSHLAPTFWVTVALVLSLASWALSKRLIRRSSLL